MGGIVESKSKEVGSTAIKVHALFQQALIEKLELKNASLQEELRQQSEDLLDAKLLIDVSISLQDKLFLNTAEADFKAIAQEMITTVFEPINANVQLVDDQLDLNQ